MKLLMLLFAIKLLAKLSIFKYDTLIFNMSDSLIPGKICLEKLVTFQTSAPMIPFLIDSLESLVQGFAERFIVLDILKKFIPTYKLSLSDMKNATIKKE